MDEEQKVKPIIMIGLNEKGQIVVTGPIDNKSRCIELLAETIKIINGLPQKPASPIINPSSGMPLS